MPVKSRFAAARLRRKTHEGRGDPIGPAQMDCQNPVRFLGYIGSPIHAIPLVMRWKIPAARTDPMSSIGIPRVLNALPKAKVAASATKVVRKIDASETGPIPSGYVIAQMPSGNAKPLHPGANKAPQKNKAANGWKFGKVSGNRLPTTRKAIRIPMMRQSGR